MSQKQAAPLDILSRFVWVEFPVSVARFSPRVASSFTEGQHLMKWPLVAALSPILASIAGATTEYFQGAEVFTTSWIVVIVMGAIGLSSVQLGAWAFVGYVAADLLSGRSVGRSGQSDLPTQLDWIAGPISAAVEYLLLGLLVIGLPGMVLSVRLAIRQRGFHNSIGIVGERLIHVLVIAAGAWFWCQLVITSVRTIFTVGGWPEETAAVFTTQEQWPLIVVALAVVGVARFIIEAKAHRDGALEVAIETQQRLAPYLTRSQGNAWVRAAFQALVGVMLLGGIIDTWQQIVVTAAVFLYLAAARQLVARTSIGRLILKVPTLVRLGLALVVSYVVLSQMAEAARQGPDRGFFLPWLAVVISLLIIGLASISAPPRETDQPEPPTPPDQPPAPPDQPQSPSPNPPARPRSAASTQPLAPPAQNPRPGQPPTPPPGGLARRIVGGVVVAVTVIAVTLFGWASPAVADNCSGLGDCFSTQAALLIALAVLLLVAAVVIVLTAPVSVPVLAGGTVLGAGVGLTSAQLTALGLAATSGYIISTQAPVLISDISETLPDLNIAQAKGRKQKVEDTGIMEEVYEIAGTVNATPEQICNALAELFAAANIEGNNARKRRIERTQKAKKCRHSSGGG